jgi:predicted PurR-regulated permease PerM
MVEKLDRKGVSNMSTVNEQPTSVPAILPPPNIVWQRRFFIALTILGWLAIAAVILWGVGKIIGPLVIIGISALVAYLIFPLIRFFQRHMPRFLAITASLLLLIAVIGGIIFFIIAAALQQLRLLIASIQNVIQHPERYPLVESLLNQINTLGISKEQFHISGQQILSHLQGTISGIVPIASSIFIMLITLLLVTTLAVYLMIDGERINHWFRYKTPMRYRGTINMFLDELDRSVGGFVRGQVLLATVMSAIVGIGALIIGVPYVFLLVIIVFVCEFIPQIGSYISGAIGVGFALTQGWQVALIYAIFVSIMQGGVDGQILAPRIVGHAVGLHPILSISALLVGAALFGLLGAFFACPAAAILQSFVRAFWDTWREKHPEQFPDEEKVQQSLEVAGHDQPAVST